MFNLTKPDICILALPLLQYLDALKEIKNLSLKILRKKISELPGQDQARLISLAEKYNSPQVRALVGLLFSSLNLSVPESLALSLNPTTTYKLGLNQHDWPTAKNWKTL